MRGVELLTFPVHAGLWCRIFFPPTYVQNTAALQYLSIRSKCKRRYFRGPVTVSAASIWQAESTIQCYIWIVLDI